MSGTERHRLAAGAGTWRPQMPGRECFSMQEIAALPAQGLKHEFCLICAPLWRTKGKAAGSSWPHGTVHVGRLMGSYQTALHGSGQEAERRAGRRVSRLTAVLAVLRHRRAAAAVVA